jgi:hypothetical protein
MRFGILNAGTSMTFPLIIAYNEFSSLLADYAAFIRGNITQWRPHTASAPRIQPFLIIWPDGSARLPKATSRAQSFNLLSQRLDIAYCATCGPKPNQKQFPS